MPNKSTQSDTDTLPYGSILADRPTEKDTLGFSPYVRALRDFIIDPGTNPPVTISIEGEWGVGKSSFMRQLNSQVRKSGYKTVEFHPWRHENEDALWAAFALEFITQVSDQLRLDQRWIRSVKLRFLRGSHQGWLYTFRDVLFATFILLITIAFPVALFLSEGGIINRFLDFLPWFPKIPAGTTILGTGGFALSLAGIITVFIKMKTHITETLRLDIRRYFNEPNYDERVAFVSQFHEDFDRILNSYVGEERVVVFIDDLDRCEPAKAAELMEAINLMLASNPRLIFVIGADREKIAAGIATQHESIFPYLTKSNNRESKLENNSWTGLDYGFKYMDKFIQVPFLVPKPSIENVDEFLKDIFGIENESHDFVGDIGSIAQTLDLDSENQDDPSKSLTGVELLEEHREVLLKVTLFISPIIDFNPRRIKKFVNLFKLHILIAYEERLINITKEGELTEDSLTFEQLGKFVAIMIQWPRLLIRLRSNPEVLSKLAEATIEENIDEYRDEPMVWEWLSDEALVELIRLGKDAESETWDLRNLDIDVLLSVIPESPASVGDKHDFLHTDVPGEVKFFHDMKNYGFITATGIDDDVFFHLSELDNDSISEGDKVTIDIVQGDRGPKATNVKTH